MTTASEIVRCILSDIGDAKAGMEYALRIASSMQLNPYAFPGDANEYFLAARMLKEIAESDRDNS